MPHNSSRNTRIAIVGNPNSIHDWEMANALANHPDGFSVQYITNQPLEPYSGLASQLQVHTWLPATFRPLRSAFTGEIHAAVQQFAALHQAQPFDLVLSSYFFPYGLWAWQFSQATGLPHLAVVHGSDLLVDYRLRLMRPTGFRQALAFGQLRHAYRQAIQAAALVMGNSPALLSVARSLGVPQDRTALLRPLVDFAALDACVNQINDQKLTHTKDINAPRIFSPRLVKPIYNTDLQIRALQQLQQQYPAAQLTLIDPNPHSDYSQAVRALINQMGLADAVQLLPWQPRQAMIRLYMTSDMVLLTPSSDGLPVTGLEALYLRSPLVLGTQPWLPLHLRYEQCLLGPQHAWCAQAHSPEAVSQALAQCWALRWRQPQHFIEKLEAGHQAAKSLGGKAVSIQQLASHVNSASTRNIQKTLA